MTDLNHSPVLAPYQRRVIDEKKELDNKIEALAEFIHGEVFSTVNAPEQRRLRSQLTIMRTFSAVLGDRIAAFPPT